MKKIVSIGLSILLLYHTLAYVLVSIGTWWQAEHDLSKRLLVYRSVDSLVEFQIPLANHHDATSLTSTTTEGFSYRGHYYDVVSLEVRGDTLHIAGLESAKRSFWQSDLLSFLNNHLGTESSSDQKASQFLKFLLKEYSPNPRTIFSFLPPLWREAIRIADANFVAEARSLPVHSPPPEV